MNSFEKHFKIAIYKSSIDDVQTTIAGIYAHMKYPSNEFVNKKDCYTTIDEEKACLFINQESEAQLLFKVLELGTFLNIDVIVCDYAPTNYILLTDSYRIENKKLDIIESPIRPFAYIEVEKTNNNTILNDFITEYQIQKINTEYQIQKINEAITELQKTGNYNNYTDDIRQLIERLEKML